MAGDVRSLDVTFGLREIEIFKNALITITDEMGITIRRSSFSTNLKARADFSCAIFDDQCRMIAQSVVSNPGHFGKMARLVPSAIREYGADRLSPDDIILLNDPYMGAGHLNDMVLIAPVYAEERLIAYVANLAHHVDVGGSSPGSVGALNNSIFQEGIFVPPVKLMQHGRLSEDMLTLILANVRSRRENEGDFMAQIAANRVAVDRMHALIGRMGSERMRDGITTLLRYTEDRVRHALRAFPEGEYTATVDADPDAGSAAPIRFKVKVTLRGGTVDIDFTGSNPQSASASNLVEPLTFSAAVFPFKCLIPQDISANDGFYRCFRCIAPVGTVVNCRYPAAVSGGGELSHKVLEAVLRALAPIVPSEVPAMGKGTNGSIKFGFSDPLSGRPLVFHEALGGGAGALPYRDGTSAVQVGLQNTECVSTEELESLYPLRVLRHELIPNSGGAGRYRGGLGIRKDYLLLTESVCSTILDCATFPPLGLAGGGAAQPSAVVVNPGTPDERLVRPKGSIKLAPMSVLSVRTPGGGGHGDPHERDKDLIQADLTSGFTTERDDHESNVWYQSLDPRWDGIQEKP